MTRDEALERGRKKGAPLGGRAVKGKTPPDTCLRCGRSMAGRRWHSYLGHLGLHGLADKYFGGDIEAAQKRLRQNALARQDPAPWNGAWPRYVPVTKPGADQPEPVTAGGAIPVSLEVSG
jgi:hypothetical protein